MCSCHNSLVPACAIFSAPEWVDQPGARNPPYPKKETAAQEEDDAELQQRQKASLWLALASDAMDIAT